jgi:hypothetical protein
VPETTDQKYNQEIYVKPCRDNTISTKGYVKVISEPGGKGDMPASPELSD